MKLIHRDIIPEDDHVIAAWQSSDWSMTLQMKSGIQVKLIIVGVPKLRLKRLLQAVTNTIRASLETYGRTHSGAASRASGGTTGD